MVSDYRLITGDSAEVLVGMSAGSVDMVCTSPPYDNLRDYRGYRFDFAAIAVGLVRVLKDGGVIMWNVADETIDGSESGTSFRQALYFMDECRLRLHDTMIYEKMGSPYAAGFRSNRYTNIFEYCFVLSKGKPRAANLIADKLNNWGGQQTFTNPTQRGKDGELREMPRRSINEFGVRTNIWRVKNGKDFSSQNQDAHQHPATMPLGLAADHIKTWTNEGDIVLDPFSGSGTSGVAALQLGRSYIGIDISADYNDLARSRIEKEVGGLL